MDPTRDVNKYLHIWCNKLNKGYLILKIGKGTLPVHIAGIYTGRYTHSNQLADGNEEVQRLCGKNGVARGKEKYTVARSESTTVIGVILYYKNQIPDS